MDFNEQRTSALLKKELEKVFKNEEYFYAQILDEDMKKLKSVKGDSIYDMLKNPNFREAYFKATTLKVEKIEGYLVYAVADNGKTHLFDLETMTTPQLNNGKIRGFEFKDDDLIVNVEKSLAGSEEIMIYFNTNSKVNNFSKLPRDTFDLLTMTGQLKGPDLIALCSTDSRANSWCDQQFYRRAIIRDFPNYEIPMPMDGHPDYKQLYRSMWLPDNYHWTHSEEDLITGTLKPIFYGIQTNFVVVSGYYNFLRYEKPTSYFIGLTHEGNFLLRDANSKDGDGSGDKTLERWSKDNQNWFDPPEPGLFANARQFSSASLNSEQVWHVLTFKGDLYVFPLYKLHIYLDDATGEVRKPTWKLLFRNIRKVSDDLRYSITEQGSLLKFFFDFLDREEEIKLANNVVLIRNDVKELNFDHIFTINHSSTTEGIFIFYIDPYYQLSRGYAVINRAFVVVTSNIIKPAPEDGNKFQCRSIWRYSMQSLGFQGSSTLKLNLVTMTNTTKEVSYRESLSVGGSKKVFFEADGPNFPQFSRFPEAYIKSRVLTKITDLFLLNRKLLEFEKGPAVITTTSCDVTPTPFRNLTFNVGRYSKNPYDSVRATKAL